MNYTAFYTLFKKEVLRFWKVSLQTISAPIISALLYQLIFSYVMKGREDIMPIFIQLTPISYVEFFCAYVGAAILRGLLVGLGVILVTAFFGLPMPQNILWILFFALSACAVMGIFGLLAGVVAEKFDQLAMFQNFLIMPLTFLSGVFYSINGLPPFWQTLSRFNPLFYMIDGFRFGFFGQSDISPYFSACVVLFFLIVLSILMLALLKSGYKMRK